MRVVIIGSGLGGLACGAILAKNGYEVTVLEKHSVIGGCLQCFKRRGKKFETGMHYVGGVAEGQTMVQLMRYLEIDDKVTFSALDPKAYDIISIAGKHFQFARGRRAFIDQMSEHFPDQRENLERFFDLLDALAKESTLTSSNVNSSFSPLMMDYQLKSVNETISSIITDETLQKVLVGNLPLFAGEQDKTPFLNYAFIMSSYNQGAYRIAGGSDTVAKALLQTIEKYGGRVLTQKEMTAVECNDQKAVAVVVNGEERVEADSFVAAIHPQRLFERLDTNLIRPIYRRRVAEIPNTVSCFTVYVDFKKEKMPYLNSNFYSYLQGSPWNCEKYTDETWPKGYLYMHQCPKNGKQWAEAGVIICYMWMDDVRQWMGTKVGNRGFDYEDFKRQKAEKLIDAVENDFPGFRNTIAHYYTSTPLTYYDYTATTDGAMYGIAKDVKNAAASHISYRTRVPNLYLTGQNVNSHGMLGVLVGAVITSSEFMHSDVIIDQIRTCNR